MTGDPNKKTARTFQCRDVLWDSFEGMARDLDCSVDYLINEAMKQYGKQRNLSNTMSGGGVRANTPEPGPSPVAAPPARLGAPTGLNLQRPPIAIQTGNMAAHVPAPASASPVASAPAMAAPPAAPPNLGGTALRVPTAGFPKPPGVPPVPGRPPTGGMPRVPTMTGTNLAPPPLAGHAPAHHTPPAAPAMPAPPPLAAPIASPASSTLNTGAGVAQGSLSILFNGERHVVSSERYIIGRGKQVSDLTVKDPNVSRQHAMIEYQAGAYYIVDMGSTNGIEFGGQRVTRKQIVEGDVCKICDYEFRFTFR